MRMSEEKTHHVFIIMWVSNLPTRKKKYTEKMIFPMENCETKEDPTRKKKNPIRIIPLKKLLHEFSLKH